MLQIAQQQVMQELRTMAANEHICRFHFEHRATVCQNIEEVELLETVE
jgi:hypothetical protein